MSYRAWKIGATRGLCLVVAVACLLVPGGCPSSLVPQTPSGNTGPVVGGTDQTGDSDDTDGQSDGIDDNSVPSDDSGPVSDDGGDAPDATDDATTPAGSDTADGLTAGAIIFRAAGGFAVDTTINLPAEASFNVSDSGIKSSVRIPRVTKDGSRIWFAAQDGNTFVQPQLFCINVDGSGIEEVALPAEFGLAPVELWPSADGELCALILNTGQGTLFSQSVVALANRSTKQVTTLFDGRTLNDGNDDFANLQLTDDGSTVLFMEVNTSIIYRVPAAGGSLNAVSTLGDYTRADSTPREIVDFRANGDASAFVLNVEFAGPNNTYPNDIYLKAPLGVMALTNTGDAPDQFPYNYLDISDDARYVAYWRFHSDQSAYSVHVLDRQQSTTATLDDSASSAPLHLSGDGSVVLTSWPIGKFYGNVGALSGLGIPDGSSALQVVEEWAGDSNRPPYFTSLSAAGDVLVGTWNEDIPGTDTDRLYVWLPNATAYRDGPSVSGVAYKLDPAAGTLYVRVTATGNVTQAALLGFFENFESFYQLEELDDPFYTERFGSAMAATDTPGVFEHTSDWTGLTLDQRFRVRITVADNDAKNFAVVDFRPVPIDAETADVNGDGSAD